MKAMTSLAWVAVGVLLGVTCIGCMGSTEDGGAKASATPAAREFAVEGMTCDGCVSHLTSALKKVPGVRSVEVSLESKNAVVDADESLAPPEKIEAAISAAGYKGRLVASGGPAQ